MSHANGLVRFDDGTVRFFEYNGTSDACRPKHWKNYRDVQKHWREETYVRTCRCKRPPETVEAFTDYGRGFTWMTTACRHCRVIVDCSNPYDLGIVRHEIPEWDLEIGLTSVNSKSQ